MCKQSGKSTMPGCKHNRLTTHSRHSDGTLSLRVARDGPPAVAHGVSAFAAPRRTFSDRLFPFETHALHDH
jgi:hypothetical protein